MTRLTVLSAAAILGFGRSVFAGYDDFFFASEASEWKCPKMAFDCVAPNVCAHEGLLNKYYCCGAGSTDAICWAGSVNCGAGEGEPAGGQIGCSEGVNAFCCLADREECTQRFNQINICWATPANPIANISVDKLNETFSSLTSAKPRATSLSIDISALLATSTPASTSASASASSGSGIETAESAQSGTTAPTNIPSANNDNGLSGGAIGGIVVGAIAGLAAVGAGVFFLLRRNKNKAHGSELDSNPYSHNGYAGVAQAPPQEKYAHEAAAETPAPHYPPVEMPAGYGPSEMEGSKPQGHSQLH